jgi:hypothetical protein
VLQIEKPKKFRERAERIYKAADEINRAMSAMHPMELIHLTCNFVTSRHAPHIISTDQLDPMRPIYSTDMIRFFVSALKDGAKKSEIYADQLLIPRPAKSKNADWYNYRIAVEVAEIYFRVTNLEPPKAGANGPYQRLLRDVYEAVGRRGVDLRGPLRVVHESRKNRHS